MLLLQRQEELSSCRRRLTNDEGVVPVAATSGSIEEPDRDDPFPKKPWCSLRRRDVERCSSGSLLHAKNSAVEKVMA